MPRNPKRARSSAAADPLPPEIELAYRRWHDAYDLDALCEYLRWFDDRFRAERKRRGDPKQTGLDDAAAEIRWRVGRLREWLRSATAADRRAALCALELGAWLETFNRELTRGGWFDDRRLNRDDAIRARVAELRKTSKAKNAYELVAVEYELSVRSIEIIVRRAT